MGSRRAANSPCLGAAGLGLLVLTCTACAAGGDGPPAPTVYRDYALVVAAGSDQILSYSIDRETGGLTAAGSAAFPAGSSPRSIALGPDDKFAYVVGSSWRYPCVFRVLVDPASGALTVSNLLYGMADEPLRVESDPSGKFVYVTCGSADRIYGFYADPGTGSLSVLPGSPFAAPGGPVEIAFEPRGRFAYVLNYGTESVSLYTVDRGAGSLALQPWATVGVGGGPEAIIIDPSGRFLYVVNRISGDISAFTIDGATGTLTLFATPATSWDSPQAMAFEPSGKYAYMVYFRPTAYITAHAFDPQGSLLIEGMLEAGGYAHDVVVARIPR